MGIYEVLVSVLPCIDVGLVHVDIGVAMSLYVCCQFVDGDVDVGTFVLMVSRHWRWSQNIGAGVTTLVLVSIVGVWCNMV